MCWIVSKAKWSSLYIPSNAAANSWQRNSEVRRPEELKYRKVQLSRKYTADYILWAFSACYWFYCVVCRSHCFFPNATVAIARRRGSRATLVHQLTQGRRWRQFGWLVTDTKMQRNTLISSLQTPEETLCSRWASLLLASSWPTVRLCAKQLPTKYLKPRASFMFTRKNSLIGGMNNV